MVWINKTARSYEVEGDLARILASADEDDDVDVRVDDNDDGNFVDAAAAERAYFTTRLLA